MATATMAVASFLATTLALIRSSRRRFSHLILSPVNRVDRSTDSLLVVAIGTMQGIVAHATAAWFAATAELPTGSKHAQYLLSRACSFTRSATALHCHLFKIL